MNKLSITLASVLLSAAIVAAPYSAAHAATDTITTENTAETSTNESNADLAKVVKAEVKQKLYDADGRKIGRVEQIHESGAVSVIYKGKIVTVTADSLSLKNGKLTTSYTARELSRR